MKVGIEQAAEHESLGKLQQQVNEAQAAHAEHVSEVTAQLDAKEKRILADANVKAAADRDTFSYL